MFQLITNLQFPIILFCEFIVLSSSDAPLGSLSLVMFLGNLTFYDKSRVRVKTIVVNKNQSNFQSITQK